MYKCCIFDLDGTLVNSIYALNKSVDETLNRFHLGPITEEQTKIFVGDGYKKLIERALIACGDKELVHYEEGIRAYAEIFKERCLYRLEAYDGIKELLGFLKENNIKRAVLTNKPHERALENIDYVFAPDDFDIVLGEQESRGIKKKPAPDGVWDILGKFGMQKEECLYFGDTNTDMETGKNAGVDTVGVTWGFRPREELAAYHPKLLADNTAEVIRLIKDVNHIE